MNFCYPVLPLAGYTVWDGCGFLDPKYLQYERAQHPGVDYNGLRGGDSDLGAPVYSVAAGTVVHAREHRVWGNIVLVQHGPQLWSQYAHLDTVLVGIGQTVTLAEQLGTIGKGGKSPQYPRGRYAAHLHFEIRQADVPADEWPSVTMTAEQAAKYIRRTRLDPQLFLARAGALTVVPVAAPPSVPTTPPPGQAAPEWVPLYDPATARPIPGEYVSVRRRGAEFRLFKVPPERLAERGLK